MFEQYVTISCVSNEVGGNLVGNAKWTGVRLREVLALAGVQASATQLVGRSVDGWTAGMPTAWVMDPDREPMIAVRMNDQPLPTVHGFPARLIVPGLYGYVSATKWLAELELTTLESFDGYWVPLGWSKEAPILTQSRIDTPLGQVSAGTVPDRGDRLGARPRDQQGRGRHRRDVVRGEAVAADLGRDLGPVGRWTGRPRPGSTPSRSAPPMGPARPRPTWSARPPRTGPGAGTRGASRSAEDRPSAESV